MQPACLAIVSFVFRRFHDFHSIQGQSLKDKSGVSIINAREQTYQLLPRMMGFFPQIGISDSCKLVKYNVNLDQRSSPIFHETTMKGLAAIEGQENNKAASFSLSVTSEKHRFFALMTSLSLYCSFEYVISLRKDEKWGERYVIS